jgi:hypothetical protein
LHPLTAPVTKLERLFARASVVAIAEWQSAPRWRSTPVARGTADDRAGVGGSGVRRTWLSTGLPPGLDVDRKRTQNVRSGFAVLRPFVLFDVNSLLASLFVSSIGFVLFVYGKKMNQIPHLVTGLTLLLFPYFVSGALWILLIGAVVLALFWLGLRSGMY